ncbi:MAG: GNAT family N-acetyltransferase, partial [Shimia sp.]
MSFAPVTLTGATVTLRPLDASHAEALRECVSEGDLWRIWETTIPASDAVETEIARRLSLQTAGSMVPFSIFVSDTLVGQTTYMNIDRTVPRVEIGSTFLRPSAHRTGVNREMKRMMLAHAFETEGAEVVEFRTHRLNMRSRRAIEGLGAQFDGILRSHQRLRDGTLRDTAVYSITAAEWPAVSAICIAARDPGARARPA